MQNRAAGNQVLLRFTDRPFYVCYGIRTTTIRPARQHGAVNGDEGNLGCKTWLMSPLHEIHPANHTALDARPTEVRVTPHTRQLIKRAVSW